MQITLARLPYKCQVLCNAKIAPPETLELKLNACTLETRNPKLETKGVSDLGKVLIFFGAVLVVIGALLVVLGRTHFPLGRLPGDILYRGKHGTFYFPLMTCILLSVVLSLLMYVVNHWRK